MFSFSKRADGKVKRLANITATKGAVKGQFQKHYPGRESGYQDKKPISAFSPVIAVLMLFVLSTLSIQAQAANWFVRPNGGSYGSENGTDWSNAFDGFSDISWGSVSCGDTIWVAGGSYSQDLSPNKDCSNSSRTYIRRARSDSAACKSAAGWSSNFDSLIYQTRPTYFRYDMDNFTVSGRTTASGGDHGWKIRIKGYAKVVGIDFLNGISTNYITIEYLEIQGDGGQYAKDNMRGVDDSPYNSSSGHHTLSHLKIHGWESAVYSAFVDDHVSEYLEIYNIYGTGAVHPNIYYIKNSNNGIIRYSKIYNTAASGTGIAFSDGGPFNNWKIYGNLFYGNTDRYASVIAIQESPAKGLKIYNNTFSNNGTNFRTSGGGSCGSGAETKNNLYYGSGGTISCGTTSNNLKASSDPFIDRSNDNYKIVATIGGSYPRDAGTSLTINNYINYDMNGVRRGADGRWDVGAYEFDADHSEKPSPQKPLPPINLRILNQQ